MATSVAVLSQKKATKAQKKRRAAQKRENDLPFVTCQDVTSESCVSRATHPTEPQRTVPSLVSVCVRWVKKRYPNTIKLLPKKIQYVIGCHEIHKYVRETQLAWGLMLLDSVNSHVDKDRLLQLKDGGKGPAGILKVFNPYSRGLIPCKNVGREGNNLAVSHVCCHTLPGLVTSEGMDINNGYIQTAVCDVLEHLLPETLGVQLNTHHVDDLKATLTAKIRVKKYLLKKYRMLEPLLAHCWPYMWWGRGSLHLAISDFTYLISICKEDKTNAYYYNELGRLYEWQHDRESAVKWYHLAANICPAADDSAHSLAMVLSAAVWDQGLMDDRSADHSQSLWTTALHTADAHHKTHVAAALMDSLLSYHGGRDFSAVLDVVQSLISYSPLLFYHISLLQALLGLGSDSQNSYTHFVSKCPSVTLNYLGENPFPWQPIVNWVTKGKVKVTPMTLKWRTRLRSLCLTEKASPFCVECDIPSQEVNFELSEDGCVTGELQMLCPGITKIHLRMDSGQVQFSSSSMKNNVTKVKKFVEASDVVCLQPPCLTTLYDLDPVTVHMLNRLRPDGHSVDLKLYRYEDGEFSTLDITPLFNNAIKEFYLKQIELKYEYRKDDSRKTFQKDRRDHDHWYRLIRETVNKYHNLGQLPKLNDIEKEVGHKIKVHQGRDGQSCDRCVQNEYKPATLVLGYYRVVGQTVVLFFNGELIMFIKVHSREAFLSPPKVIHRLTGVLPGSTCLDNVTGYTGRPPFIETDGSFWKDRQVDYEGHCFLCSQCYYRGSSVEFIVGFDAEGRIRDFDLWPGAMEMTFAYCETIGDILYAVNDAKNRLLAVYPEYSIRTRAGAYGNIRSVRRATSDHLLLLSDRGLCVLQPKTLNFLTIKPVLEAVAVEISRDSFWVKTDHQTLKVIGSQQVRQTVTMVTKVAVAIGDLLVVLKLPAGLHTEPVEVIFAQTMPGQPREVCFISQTAGFLVCTSIFTPTSAWARDLILHMDYEGNLHRILPILGPGNHSLTVLSLNMDILEKTNQETESGDYLVFRDQLGGICCSKITI